MVEEFQNINILLRWNLDRTDALIEITYFVYVSSFFSKNWQILHHILKNTLPSFQTNVFKLLDFHLNNYIPFTSIQNSRSK